MDPFKLGFYGAILGILAPIPWIGWILGIAGFVLLTLAYYRISKEKGKPEIWKNYLTSLVVIIVGVIVAVLLGGLTLFTAYKLGNIYAALLSALPAIIIGYLAFVASAYFYKRALESVAEVTGINLFRTAGFLYFLGNILLIILVGGILNIVASILLIVAFYEAKEKAA